MRVSFAPVLSVVAVAVTAAACSASPPIEQSEPVGATSSAVINGQLDTSHQAVVALILQQGSQGGLCSGTIAKVDPAKHIGWVVTAAHCVEVPPALVVQGDDILSPTALRYEVIDYKADARYTGEVGSSYDFAVVRIAGVDAKTPTIGVVPAPDGMDEGTPVTSVGYGRTTLIQSGTPDENTKRRSVTRVIGQVGATQVAYDMSDRGICQGDSGGPVLIQTPGGERVAGIHSFVQGDCDGVGVSGRAAAGTSFWNAEMSKATPKEDCGLCGKIVSSGNGECAVLTRACLADKECKGYYECIAEGGKKDACLLKFPKAEGPFTAAEDCACTRGCADKCKDVLACHNAAKCGYRLPAGDCSTCTEGACCQEELDCAADGTCYLCLKKKDGMTECSTNPARKKLATCVASKCKTECAGSGLDTGADPVPEEGGPGGNAAPTKTVTTTEGCSAAPGRASGGAGFGALLALGLAVAARRRYAPATGKRISKRAPRGTST